MDKTYEEAYHLQEEINWWFIARRDFILRWLKGHRISPASRILDIGSGGGSLGVFLKKNGFQHITCIDFSEEAITMCRQRGLESSFVHDAQDFNFDEPFDLIIASDCLEHLEHDQKALTTWFRNLKPGGMALVFVPAHAFLWSEHDIINHHFRRYKRAELVEKMKKAGFVIEQSGFWNFILFFPLAFMSLFRRKAAADRRDEKTAIFSIPAWLNAVLKNWLYFENRLGGKKGFPAGVSAFAWSRRPLHTNGKA
jgi:SAM-dependent methyltransferase